MKIALKFVASLIAVVVFRCGALDCYVFRTGDANFILLRAEKKVLIVDCGVEGFVLLDSSKINLSGNVSRSC